jgi:chromate reductase, NAD(P)H dehydrogenase (quinone)
MAASDGKEIRVLGIAGSLREGSYNRALIRAASEVAPEGMTVEEFPLHDIPLFNEDVEKQGYPEPVRRMHEAIGAADALLIATPEYQHGVPGVLKNAIDWASRPPGKAAILGKPTAVLGATPGMWGTQRAQTQLRQALIYNRCPVVLSPEVLVANAKERIDAEGRLTHEATRGFVGKLLEALAELTLRHRADPQMAEWDAG